MTNLPTDFWTPTASNELHLPDASILIGGPLGQELSEHSHDFIQISACFHTRKADVGREEKAPDYFSRPGVARPSYGRAAWEEIRSDGDAMERRRPIPN